ncbi:hypothetical protein EJ02DRAFT_208261 [Clathrospora elynae]|uniref:Uncharacterized protein n=1 Tax=Clathrospora elynae TaxID=706981 RepID=A0A6A5SP78_9PLEO|nr:hypothetical protein EJ02DRAFT_208261 [Clathrospora elynae]
MNKPRSRKAGEWVAAEKRQPPASWLTNVAAAGRLFAVVTSAHDAPTSRGIESLVHGSTSCQHHLCVCAFAIQSTPRPRLPMTAPLNTRVRHVTREWAFLSAAIRVL